MIDLIILSAIKLIFQKSLFKIDLKIDKIHIVSTICPLIFYLLTIVIYKKNIEYTILVSTIFLLGSYIIVNIPGAYLTSIRIKIFEILYENKNLNKKEFYQKFNDELLFTDRFNRINKYNIISTSDNKQYYLISKKISFLIWFVGTMRKIYNIINKY